MALYECRVHFQRLLVSLLNLWGGRWTWKHQETIRLAHKGYHNDQDFKQRDPHICLKAAKRAGGLAGAFVKRTSVCKPRLVQKFLQWLAVPTLLPVPR